MDEKTIAARQALREAEEILVSLYKGSDCSHAVKSQISSAFTKIDTAQRLLEII